MSFLDWVQVAVALPALPMMAFLVLASTGRLDGEEG